MAKKATKKTVKIEEEEAVASPPVSRSPAAEKDQKLTKAALKQMGKDMMEAKGRAPFSVPKDGDELIKRASELNEARDAGETELSALLYAAQEDKLYAIHGQANLSELAESKMGISGSKARTLANNYQNFINLGLEPKLLRHISWSKFKELARAIKKEYITPRSIAEWLPLIKDTGPGSLSLRGVQERVKELITKSESTSEDEPISMRKMSFEIPSDQLEGYRDLVESLKEALGVDSDSAAIVRALQETASSRIEGAEAQAAYMGLQGLRNMMARTAPVTPIVIANDENVTFENVGVPVLSTLYYAMKNTEVKGCFATSKEAAAESLGVSLSSVREMEFSVASDFTDGLPSFQGSFLKQVIDEEEGEESTADPVEMLEDTEIEAEETSETGADVEVYEVDQSWVGWTVTAMYKGEEIEGEIVKVDEESETFSLKVPGARGRPKAVAFADIVAVSEDEEEETEEVEEVIEEVTPDTEEVEEAEETESSEDLFEEEEEEEEEESDAPHFEVEDTKAMMEYVSAIGKALLADGSPDSKKRAKGIKLHYKVLQEQYEGEANSNGLALHDLVSYAHREAVEAGLDIDALS